MTGADGLFFLSGGFCSRVPHTHALCVSPVSSDHTLTHPPVIGADAQHKAGRETRSRVRVATSQKRLVTEQDDGRPGLYGRRVAFPYHPTVSRSCDAFFKVLFTFRSPYLCAVGLERNTFIPDVLYLVHDPASNCIPKQPDSCRIAERAD